MKINDMYYSWVFQIPTCNRWDTCIVISKLSFRTKRDFFDVISWYHVNTLSTQEEVILNVISWMLTVDTFELHLSSVGQLSTEGKKRRLCIIVSWLKLDNNTIGYWFRGLVVKFLRERPKVLDSMLYSWGVNGHCWEGSC